MFINKTKIISLVTGLLIFLQAFSFSLPVLAKNKNYVDKVSRDIEAKSPNDEDYFDSEVAMETQKSRESRSGSLWMDAYSSHLYDNMYRASKIGDTVMIIVEESAQGTNNGNTKADSKNEESASIDNLGGMLSKVAQIVKLFDPANIIGAKRESKFQGKGETSRKGNLTARLSAIVTNVLHNGNMVIKGEQHLKINKEDQVLIVEGIIRPYDIRPDNTVLSSSVAKARITFSGFGVVGEKQSPGWLTRVLNYIWPF